MTRKHLLLLGVILSFVPGCSTAPTPVDPAPRALEATHGPVLPTYQPVITNEGSLWSPAQGINLFPDKRARNIGDIVIVRIVEDPEASLDAKTNTTRTSGLDASKLQMLGYMEALAESNSRLAQSPGSDDLMLASLGLRFDGKGSSDRNGHVSAYVSAVVEAILPNGNLYIAGRRQIRVNNETEYITISGMIRPEDISPSNEISSVYVANARIGYAGVGPIADKQKPGWLGRVVDHVWPF